MLECCEICDAMNDFSSHEFPTIFVGMIFPTIYVGTNMLHIVVVDDRLCTRVTRPLQMLGICTKHDEQDLWVKGCA